MAICKTSVIMAALTISVFLNDVWRNNVEDVPIHIFLGLLVTMLFYGLCEYGYEIINWICLGLIVCVLIFSGIQYYINQTIRSSCTMCRNPVNSCGCRSKPKTVNECNRCNKPVRKCSCAKAKPKLNCPAKPITLNTVCGISRFN
jgi:hypothetical protein